MPIEIQKQICYNTSTTKARKPNKKGNNIMKATGIVRRTDDLGRICIPKEVMRALNIEYGEALEIFMDENCVILKKYHTTPIKDELLKMKLKI